MRFAAFTLAVAAVCFYLGLQVGKSGSATSAKRIAEDAQASPAPTMACAVSVDPSILRAEFAKALASALPTVRSAPPDQGINQAPTAADPGPAPSPAQVAAFDHGQAIFERAVRQGHMSVAESRELRGVLVNMDDSSRLELTRRMIQAMNQDKFQVEARELPF